MSKPGLSKARSLCLFVFNDGAYVLLHPGLEVQQPWVRSRLQLAQKVLDSFLTKVKTPSPLDASAQQLPLAGRLESGQLQGRVLWTEGHSLVQHVPQPAPGEDAVESTGRFGLISLSQM